MEQDHPQLAWTFRIYCIGFFKTFQQNTNLCKTTMLTIKFCSAGTVFQPYHLSQIILKKYVSWFLNNTTFCTPQRVWANTISFKLDTQLTLFFSLFFPSSLANGQCGGLTERIYWTRTVQDNWYNNGQMGLKHEPLRLTRVRNQRSNNQVSHELMALTELKHDYA